MTEKGIIRIINALSIAAQKSGDFLYFGKVFWLLKNKLLIWQRKKKLKPEKAFSCFFEIIRHLTPYVSFLLDFQYVVLILFCSNSTLIRHEFDTHLTLIRHHLMVLERLKLSVMPPFLYLILVLTLQFSRELRGLDVTNSEFTVRKVSNSLEN